MSTSTTTTNLHPSIVPGARVRRTRDSREGVVTRVLDRSGLYGGLVEVRWDGERRPNPRAGFELGEKVVPA